MILITGGNGYLAYSLIKELSNKDDAFAIMTSNVTELKKNKELKNVTLFSNEDVLSGKRKIDDVSLVIHTAFCRESDGKRLSDSLLFMEKLINRCIEDGVNGFINISSQSVYGSEEGVLPNENGVIKPNYLYALAKFSSELLLDQISNHLQNSFNYTNIRLASLIGPGKSVPNNLILKFIKSGINGEKFRVIGGKQKFSFIDVRDAAEAICRLTYVEPSKWKKRYNLGPINQTSILYIADEVCKLLKKQYGIEASYDFSPEDIQLNAGMDSSLIYQELNWLPRYSFTDTLSDTISFVFNEEK